MEGEVGSESQTNELNEYVQRRLKKLEKRRQRVEEYERIYNESIELGKPPKLNEDQIRAIQSKNLIVPVLKELKDVQSLYETVESKRKDKEQEKSLLEEARLQKRLAQAREEGMKAGLMEGQMQTRCIVEFLRAAALKRQLLNETPANETLAFEAVLTQLYRGDDTSISAVEKMYNRSEEQVNDTSSMTYKQVRGLIEKALYGKKQSSESTESIAKPAASSVVAKREFSISFLQAEEDEENEDAVLDSLETLSLSGQKLQNGQIEGKSKKSNRRRQWRKKKQSADSSEVK